MIMVYRRDKDSLLNEWHFQTMCPHWPGEDFEQVQFVNDTDNWVCAVCIRLEMEMTGENPVKAATRFAK